VNCLAETAPLDNYVTDAKQKLPPVILRRAPGITPFAYNNTNNAVRGMWMMGGVEYAVIGSLLYTVSKAGALTQVGAGIGGAGLLRMTDNSLCLVMLQPGSATASVYTASHGVSSVTLPFPATDCWFIDSYIVFVQANGRGFFNDDGQATSGNGPITFVNGNIFPREFGTDKFVGMAISNRNIYMFGERTSEIYVDSGSASTVGTPFTDAPNGFLQIGMMPGAAFTAILQNNTVYWLAQDGTIRYLSGIQPVRVSNHGIESILQSISTVGCFGFSYSLGGHLFAAWTFPASSRTLVLDVTTGEWHEMSSEGLGYWRPLCCHNAFGLYLIGDSATGQIGYLDFTSLMEFGSTRSSVWTHQPIYDENNRLSHRRLELVLGAGFAPLNGASQDVAPLITLSLSDDGGMTFRALPDRSLGTTGSYLQRQVWFGLGMSRQRVYQFELSANAASWATDLVLSAEKGRW
jgi:hypothetical protein